MRSVLKNCRLLRLGCICKDAIFRRSAMKRTKHQGQRLTQNMHSADREMGGEMISTRFHITDRKTVEAVAQKNRRRMARY